METTVDVGSVSPNILDVSNQCFSVASSLILQPGNESLAIHMLWNSIRLRLCNECIRFLAGSPDCDAELHDIAMHIYRHTGDDEYKTIAGHLLPFDGLGKILVETKRLRVRPYSTEQFNDLFEVKYRIDGIARKG